MFIIAEIGINHNGDVEIAKKLIRMAKECGCDAVKFQKRTVNLVYTPAFLKSPRESRWGSTQRAQKEGLEFGQAEYEQIDSYCRLQGIDWFASAWDLPSLEFLESFDPPYHKIASAMITNPPMLKAVAKTGKTTFISTGMSTWEDIERAVDIFRRADCPFSLMHCVGLYPTADRECNLHMIKELCKRYMGPIGYSSHSISWEDCVIAVVLAAEVIEKHITLDRAMYGSDQAASLERPGLERLVRECRKVMGYLGDGEKKILPQEAENAGKLRYWEVRNPDCHNTFGSS